MADARSPKYGLTAWTRKPVTVACNELSQAINALHGHHQEEREAFETNVAAVHAKLHELPELSADPIREALAVKRIERAAADLRKERSAALEPMLAMRPLLVDVLLEAQDILSDDAIWTADVEPRRIVHAPKPLGGIDLDLATATHILRATYEWTCEWTHARGVQALGPLYLLGRVIEHPVADASKLRADAQALEKQVRRLIYAASGQ